MENYGLMIEIFGVRTQNNALALVTSLVHVCYSTLHEMYYQIFLYTICLIGSFMRPMRI